MAKGQAKLAEKQLKTTNKVAGQQGAQADKLEGTLIPSYQSMLSPTGGMSQDDVNARVNHAMGATAGAFDTAKFEAGNRAAATHNEAAPNAMADQLALEKGTAMGDTANKVETSVSNQEQQLREQGRQGLSDMFKTNIGAEESMYGLAPSTLQARQAGAGKFGIGFSPDKGLSVGYS